MEWQYELDKAKAEGREEGIRIGEEKGKAMGLEEGRLNALLSLYKEGLLDLKTVLEKTGFTEEELKKELEIFQE